MKIKRLGKKPLDYAEEKALREEKSHIDDVLDGVELRQGVTHEVVDSAALEERKRNIDKALEGSAERATGSERVQLEKREKQLREYLQSRNVSWKVHTRTRPSDGIEYSELVDHQHALNADQKYQRMVKEWKAISRRLEPENTRAGDTRYLHRQ